MRYTNKIADEICRRIAEGESLVSICEDEGMPSRSAIFKWLDQHPAFVDRYAHARARQAEGYVEEIVTISDTLGEHPYSRKVRVDARKWVVSKLLPKKYGDRVHVDIDQIHADMDQMARVVDNALKLIEDPGQREAVSAAIEQGWAAIRAER